ncbi:MAG: amidoligase family protein [Synergistaceae bacterium]|nr:amidoligase family protein [Synergistaceae bacterium]
MTDKTAKQIENMKKQTIGVEVEMNNITREKAAKIAAEFFGTQNYQNTAAQNDYMTWSAWDGQGREWKFSRDASIAGPDAEKCELITPILSYQDIETLQELLRLLRKAGAKSSPSRGCGVHIHIGKGEHTPQTIRNLTNIMAAHEKQIGRAIKIAEHRTETYCKVINKNFLNAINANAPQTFDALADIWYTTNDANYGRDTHYNTSRYHMLNLHALFTKGTIEFRLFQFDEPHGDKKGGLHAGQLKAYIQLCLAMSELAKELKSASPKPQQTENERYDFRCWMLRLGFIGEEFKTAREILLKNMTGNGAYR